LYFFSPYKNSGIPGINTIIKPVAFRSNYGILSAEFLIGAHKNTLLVTAPFISLQ
jgi:hypothetical protein